jgi:hypothetical protein
MVLAYASTSSAQSQITDYDLSTYAQGASAPIQTYTFSAADVTCNLPPTPSGSTVNPSRAEWDDPDNVGQACQWQDPGTGPLFSLPVGTYEGTLVARSLAGASEESNRAPFSREAVPAARTGLRFAR